MKISFSKIIFFLTLLCSVAFAGGIEEDSSPDEISETTTSEQVESTVNLTTREDINEYQELSEAPDQSCIVIFGSEKYVNDPEMTSNVDYARWC
jgi:hypothetical protein